MNQCDGCRLGLPLNEHGHHYHPDKQGWERLHMACTKTKYEDGRAGQTVCSHFNDPLSCQQCRAVSDMDRAMDIAEHCRDIEPYLREGRRKS